MSRLNGDEFDINNDSKNSELGNKNSSGVSKEFNENDGDGLKKKTISSSLSITKILATAMTGIAGVGLITGSAKLKDEPIDPIVTSETTTTIEVEPTITDSESTTFVDVDITTGEITETTTTIDTTTITTTTTIMENTTTSIETTTTKETSDVIEEPITEDLTGFITILQNNADGLHFVCETSDSTVEFFVHVIKEEEESTYETITELGFGPHHIEIDGEGPGIYLVEFYDSHEYMFYSEEIAVLEEEGIEISDSEPFW